MKLRFKLIVTALFISAVLNPLFAQIPVDSGQLDSGSMVLPKSKTPDINLKTLIIPGVLIGFGVASLKNEGLLELNRSTQVEIYEHQPPRTSLDNYTQYAPALFVYGLNAAGVKGKHNFKERTIIYATSQLVAAAFVVPLKHLIAEQRPDGSNFASFPSGHTTTAFSSAQFMFREYRGTNLWLAIAGYPLATFTGVYRTLNDKHWVGDVVAGAGFGVLSTELAYWLYPKISPLFAGKKQQPKLMLMPMFSSQTLGLGLVANLN